MSTPRRISFRSIQAHYGMIQGRAEYGVRALMYPVNSLKSVVIWLPVLPGHAFEGEHTRWAMDLNVRRWYPFGSTRHVIKSVPNIDRHHPLRNHYSIVVSKESDELSTNQCVRSLSGLPHAGNVIVIRHAARCPLDVTHMPSNERTLVDLVVDRCESSHQ